MVLRLDCARVDATVVHDLADLSCDGHEVVLSRRHYVNRCDNFVFRELPNVELMNGEHAIHRKNSIPDFIQRDGSGDTLE